MESPRRRLLWTLLIAAVAAWPAQAQSDASAAAEDDGVRLYTNADLAKFGPPSKSLEPMAVPDDLGWEFVAEFLEREYERLAVDREQALKDRLLAIEEEAAASRRHEHPGYFLGPFTAVPFAPSRPFHAKRGPRARHATAAPLGVRGRIVPLHARPTPAQVHRSRAMQRSGADAVPTRPAPTN